MNKQDKKIENFRTTPAQERKILNIVLATSIVTLLLVDIVFILKLLTKCS